MSKRRIVQCLLVGALMVAVAAVPAVFLLGYVAYYGFVPRYSAVAYFDDFGFNLRLDLYRSDETKDSGRYFTVINGTAFNRMMIEGSDWPHRARTSVYRIDANHLAVLSAQGHDYWLTLKPWGVAPVGSDRGDLWRYLGAFDFVFPANAKPQLRFFDPRSAECIPMGRIDPASWATMPRLQARAAGCPSPPPYLGD